MTIRGHKLTVATFTSKKAGTGYGALAFLWAINQGAVAANVMANSKNSGFGAQAGQFFIGVPVYQLTGSGFVANSIINSPGFFPNKPVTFTLSKATNKLFWFGLTLFLYGAVGGHFGLPYAGAAMRVGGPVAVGAFIGGAFDPDAPNATPVFSSTGTSAPLISAAPGAGQPAQGSFNDSVRF